MGLGEPSSKRTRLCVLGDEFSPFSPDEGFSMDSLDNRSTSVNFASPREDDGCCCCCCTACGEFCGELNKGTD